ncbi:MAG: hypothetical protein EOO57_10640 [Hymenobacter sp.]|nr:MAG: hypothetical protein EOO57_10640 [Hymenobacter sp.]
MTANRSTSVQAFIANAHTKLLVYYRDGGVRTWYGRNNLREGRIAADPRAVEIKRHDRYVAKTAADIKIALLYDKHTGEEIRRFKNGAWS